MKEVPAAFLFPIAGSAPIYRQVYDAFREAIIDGRLHPGQRVPATRALAAELKVSRVPVVSAYEQLLAEGYFEAFAGGAGTRVSRSIPDDLIRTAWRSGGHVGPAGDETHGPRRVSRRSIALATAAERPWLRPTGLFRIGRPALDEFPYRAWGKLIARHCRKPIEELMGYGDAMGYSPFREAIAEHVSAVRGVRCTASQVLVTNGSQQALALAAYVLLDAQDRVCMEEPGYPGAHQAFMSAGARVEAVRIDAEGIDVDELIRVGREARVVYVTPSHQYPMGTTLSAARRLSLLEWAARIGVWVIEDDYDSEYRFESRPVTSLQGLDRCGRVIYIGTFSKVMYPALRLGYVVAPRDLVPAFVAARSADDVFSSTFHQAVLTDFIREGHFGRHIRRMRLLYGERREALRTAIEAQLGGVLEVTGTGAGMHFVALLPAGSDDVAVAAAAAVEGVSVTPLSTCYLKSPKRPGLVLGYAGANASQLREAVLRLKGILTQVSSRRRAVR